MSSRGPFDARAMDALGAALGGAAYALSRGRRPAAVRAPPAIARLELRGCGLGSAGVVALCLGLRAANAATPR